MAEQDERIKRELQEGNERKAKAVAEANERQKGKPTPTQEEADRAALGEHVLQHEDDGSGPDATAATRPAEAKQAEAKPGQRAGYQTRQTTPQT
jgi:hypothetical protein